jgi:hypothetical protein
MNDDCKISSGGMTQMKIGPVDLLSTQYLQIGNSGIQQIFQYALNIHCRVEHVFTSKQPN